MPPEAVWEVLADPRLYANWVVGASTTRAVDGAWPEVGAVLHHTQSLVINDTTSVLVSEPPRRLVLEARARPVVVTRVDIRLEPEGDGTLIVVDEEATGGLAGELPKSVSDAAIKVRNAETAPAPEAPGRARASDRSRVTAHRRRVRARRAVSPASGARARGTPRACAHPRAAAR